MAKVEVTMPKMGESITEGTVIAWHKQPGDRVEPDETLLEIGTDKVDTDVPSPAGGVLKEVLVQEGETVEVGTRIAVIETEVDEEEDGEPEGAAPPEAEAPEPEVEQERAEQAAPQAEAEAPPAEAEAAANEPEPEQEETAAAPADAPGEEIDVTMPKMGESITEGTVIAWHKQPGDRVEPDETLLEIGTDKVDTDVPSPAGGVLKEVLVQEGETVEVGTRIAVIATGAAAGVKAAPAPQAPGTSSKETPPSAAVKPQAKPAPEEEASAAAPSGDGAVMVPETEEGEAVPRKGSDGRFYSPLVRSIAEKEGLSMHELESIKGSGRDGRVTKQDMLAYIEDRRQAPPQEAPAAPRPQPPAEKTPAPSVPAAAPAAAPASGAYEGRVDVIRMDRMRQIIAEHMVRSKATSAHVTSFAEVDVTNLVRLRERNKEAFLKREGIKLTYTPYFVQAAVEALREHPLLNASVGEKEILVKKDFHIGIAVAIGKAGLVAPVIRNAGQKNLVGLARAAAEVAERARKKQLQPDDLQGGTFTVTNIGSLGSIMGTPIINQPQVGILATGAIKKRPVVIEDPDLGDLIAVRSIMFVSLSYDHRIIDGAMGASFLQKFAQVIETYDPNADL